MAKIQITTVEMKSNAQVIVLDANFVSRVTRALCRMEDVRSQISYEDDNGNRRANQTGMHQIFTDDVCADSFVSLTESVYDLLKDVTDAFEAE